MNESLNRQWQPDKPACEGRGQRWWLLPIVAVASVVSVVGMVPLSLPDPLFPLLFVVDAAGAVVFL